MTIFAFLVGIVSLSGGNLTGLSGCHVEETLAVDLRGNRRPFSVARMICRDQDGYSAGALRLRDPSGAEVAAAEYPFGITAVQLFRSGGRDYILLGAATPHNDSQDVIGWFDGSPAVFGFEPRFRQAVGLRRGERIDETRAQALTIHGEELELTASVFHKNDAMCCPTRGLVDAVVRPDSRKGVLRVVRASRRK
jgi:hypothetical protein